jgi:hypothetical protein
MASSLEVLNAANIQFLRNPPLLILAQTSAQALTNGAFVAITWPTPGVDTYAAWSAANPTRITPKVAGTYQVTGSIGWAVNGTGGRTAQLCKNGVANVVNQVSVGNSGSAFNTVVQVTALIACNGTTDYFELYSDQNSGVNLNSVVGVTSLTAQLVHA